MLTQLHLRQRHNQRLKSGTVRGETQNLMISLTYRAQADCRSFPNPLYIRVRRAQAVTIHGEAMSQTQAFAFLNGFAAARRCKQNSGTFCMKSGMTCYQNFEYAPRRNYVIEGYSQQGGTMSTLRSEF